MQTFHAINSYTQHCLTQYYTLWLNTSRNQNQHNCYIGTGCLIWISKLCQQEPLRGVTCLVNVYIYMYVYACACVSVCLSICVCVCLPLSFSHSHPHVPSHPFSHPHSLSISLYIYIYLLQDSSSSVLFDHMYICYTANTISFRSWAFILMKMWF